MFFFEKPFERFLRVRIRLSQNSHGTVRERERRIGSRRWKENRVAGEGDGERDWEREESDTSTATLHRMS
jgi:hypothetical protein